MTVDLWSTYSTVCPVCPVCPACVPAPPSVFLRTDHNFARFGQLRDHFSACRLLPPLPFFCPTSCCNSSTVQAGAVRMAWQQAHGSVNARSSLKKLTLWMLYLPIFADSVSAQSAPPSTAPPPPPPPACTNACVFSSDGDCDDGGPGAEFASCPIAGSDCMDCGPFGRVGIYALAPPPCSADRDRRAICEQNSTDLSNFLGIVLPSIFLGSFICLVCCKCSRRPTRFGELERRRLEGRPQPGEAGAAVEMAVAVPVDQAMVIPIPSIREQLAELNHLRAGGYLTQQELEAAKRRLLLGGGVAQQHVVMGTAVAVPAGAIPVVHQGVPVVTATAARVDGRLFAV